MIKLPEQIIELIEKFNTNHFKLYVVGGAVRDLLMKQEVKDWDFTTNATPEQILTIFPEGYYNNSFGTVGIKLSEDSPIYEITTMRKEGLYQDSRHPTQLSWTDNIEEDLSRRDFTINAMALSFNSSTQQAILVDPYNGQQDIQQKLIKAVGDPNIRFLEDALRLMRAIRFATKLQFTIEPVTFSAIQQNSVRILDISFERIRDELLKILESDYPYEGFLMLRSSGIMPYILPELEKCFGVQQEGPKHDRVYDIGEHCFLSLKYCPAKDPIVRLATLIHDIGKPDTMDIQSDGNVTFYQHDIVGAKIAGKIADRLRLSRKQKEKIISLVRWHLFTVDEKQTDSAIRRFIKNVGLENIDDILDLREADRLGGGTKTKTSWRLEKFKDRIKQVLVKPFSISDLKVNGEDVMRILNIPPSRKVGEILKKLFHEVIEEKSENNRDILLEKIKELI